MNQPWENPEFQSPYVKWLAPGDSLEGEVIEYGQGEFPASDGKPAQPYAIAFIQTKVGVKELGLSLVDLKEQWFSKKPAIGDSVSVRYLREADKKKLFDVQVTRATKEAPSGPVDGPETRF